jgi:hypothetical protein
MPRACQNSLTIFSFELNNYSMEKIIQYSIASPPYVKTLGTQLGAPLLKQGFLTVPRAGATI